MWSLVRRLDGSVSSGVAVAVARGGHVLCAHVSIVSECPLFSPLSPLRLLAPPSRYSISSTTPIEYSKARILGHTYGPMSTARVS
jgi:hypothetical protein